MVEHAAVNRRVAGSSPARGAKGLVVNLQVPFFMNLSSSKLFFNNSGALFTINLFINIFKGASLRWQKK